ncbi:hypothetical protein Q7P37_006053 [Cladosporium fusiforme]
MYRCRQCPRTYKTQTSLTRHARNHQERLATGHLCDICKTSFARRDVLTRHRHVAHQEKAARPRQRCHTACESCRVARTRCDGNEPCQSCLASAKECRYTQQSRRVSRPERPLAISSSPGETEIEVTARPPLPLPNTSERVEGLTDPVAEGSVHPETPTDATAMSLDPDPDAQQPSDISNIANDWAVDLDGMSWPWVHETLFLHDDPPFTSLFTPAPSQSHLLNNWSEALESSNGPGSQIESTDYVPATLSSEVDTMIRHATEVAHNPESQGITPEYWQAAAVRLHSLLGESGVATNTASGCVERAASPHVLHRAIVVHYLPNFNRLWPMFSDDELQPENLHAVLYLVLVSIGSMYGSDRQKQFGMLLHKALRRLLSASLFELETPEGDLIWLAQARLLTQVQGLYFGQPQSFSYAQHLGAILVTQARRLELFQQPAHMRTHVEAGNMVIDPEAPKIWFQSEARKRLAFGILRADVFTSVLLNSRPLLSYDEIDLTMPCSDDLWRNPERLSSKEQVLAARIEGRHYPPIMFSDILRILLDRQETIPAMDSVSHELCLFGLQAPIWKVSHDPDLFRRLTGNDSGSHNGIGETRGGNKERYTQELGTGPIPGRGSDQTAQSYTEDLLSDALVGPTRAMLDMHADRERAEAALDRWHTSFQSVQFPSITRHRDTLMSTLLLLNMSWIRLHAPLHSLHHISYRTGEGQAVDTQTSRQGQTWAKSADAVVAATKAVRICDLIQYELERPPASRASFNFLAFGSLHHAAVVLWTMSEVGGDMISLKEDLRSRSSIAGSLLIQRETNGLLRACARLFRELSPLGGASFGLAADRLSQARFPCAPR